MPANGDQHKDTNGTARNPFESPADAPESHPRITSYTSEQVALLSHILDKGLGPEFLATRPGASGSRVHYIPADKVINLANAILGFNGWSTTIKDITIDFLDQDAQTGKINMGVSATVRVTLRDGAFHEDIGYGHIENCKGKASAFEKCKKEATTDAMKRAMRSFGRALGNCVYDKDYLSKIAKVKTPTVRWDPDTLYRHPDAIIKQDQPAKDAAKAIEPLKNEHETSNAGAVDQEFDLSDFDEAEFDDEEFVDGVILPAEKPEAMNMKRPLPQPSNPAPSVITTPSRTVPGPPSNFNDATSRPPNSRPVQHGNLAGNGSSNQPGTSVYGRQNVQPNMPHNQTSNTGSNDHSSSPGFPSQHFGGQPSEQVGGLPQPPRAGFFSARAAINLDATNNPTIPAAAPRFDPHAESPSIPKTPGIDHNKSMRLYRNLEPAPPAEERIVASGPGNAAPAPVPGFRTAANGLAAQSPSARGMTGQYRPPTRRGADGKLIHQPQASQQQQPQQDASTVYPNGVERVLQVAKRTPLSDVSNFHQQTSPQHSVTAKTADGLDAKRQRVDGVGDRGGPDQKENANATVNVDVGGNVG